MTIKYSDLERLQQDVIDTCQIIYKEHLWEQFGEGHPSARIPGTNRMITMGHLHPRGAGMGGVKTIDDLVLLDTDLRKISGKWEHMNEASIHAAIYKARSDVGGVIYAHPPFCNTFASLGVPIPTYGSHIPIWDSRGAIIDAAKGQGLVKALGNSNAILLKNPSSLVVAAADVIDAVQLVYSIENRASRDYRSLTLGIALKGRDFVLDPEFYLEKGPSDPRVSHEKSTIMVDDFDMEVQHADLWRFMYEKNIRNSGQTS